MNIAIRVVSDVKEIVDKLATAIEDLKKIVLAVTAASKSTDNAVTAITKAILDSWNIVITNKLDDESAGQLKNKYQTYLQQEEKLYNKHRVNIMICLNRTKTDAMRLSTRAMVSISGGKLSCGRTSPFAPSLASFSWK